MLKNLLRCLVAALGLVLLVPAQAQEDVSQIRQELNELRDLYEQRISDLEKKLEDSLGVENKKENKMADMRISPELKELQKQIDTLRGMVKSTSFAGAEIITFFAPALICFSADALSRNNPVHSKTTSTPSLPQGRLAGSRSAKTLIF